MKEEITLSQARLSGSKYYFTGIPCRKGHVSERQVSNRTCVMCMRDRTNTWFDKNPDYYEEYRSRNIERERIKDRQYYEENKERIAAVQRIYRQNNKDKDLARRHAAIARKKNADGRFTAEDIRKILESQDHKCKYCRADLTDGYHIDHYMPLALGGSNWPENLQCLCQSCNARKSAKHPEAWEREIGFRS